MNSKPAVQKFLKGNLHTDDENKHSHERMEIIRFQDQTSN
jgi:hypothetical protein